MQWTLDDAVPAKNTRLLLWLLIAYVVVLIANILCSLIRSRMMVRVSQGIIFDIRRDLFAHLQKLPFSYYDSRPAGKILVRVVNYVNSVSDMLSNGIVNMLLEIMNLIVIAVFMFQTNARLAAVIVADILTDFALYPWDLMLMIAGAAVWFLLFFALWRCPHCGKFLPKSDGDLAFCPYCGQNLPQDR